MKHCARTASLTKNCSSMLDKLSNERTKDAKNRRVLKVLEQAGEEIYKILD